MRKTELFAQILEIVANETELTKEQILSHDRTAEIVDARYILIYLLRSEGLYIGEIAHTIKFTRRAVEKILSQFEMRCLQSGKIFEVTLERIKNKMRTASEPSH